MMVRSPLPWIGGKFYSAKHILEAFPHPSTYKTFVDVFGGAAHVLFAKPPYQHLEVYNDYNKDLVNFWMQCRNHPEALQQQIDSLPYARSLYEDWQASLFDDTSMTDMERAVRWFYVLKSATSAEVRKAGGNWGHQVLGANKNALALHNATSFFPTLSERFQRVQIECRDFANLIATYERPTTLLYCDPPYIGAEFYYRGVSPFGLADHERLAKALNGTPAKVALSYYPHQALEDWYPVSRWRRLTWQTYKCSEKTREARQTATELLLCNYEASTQQLSWEDEDVA